MSEHTIIRVRDVMKHHFDMVDGMWSVRELLQKMQHEETKCVLIDKRYDDDEYGIVLISDIARLVLARDCAPERVNVYEIMTKPVVTVGSHMDIRYCARIFEQFSLSRAPVEDGGKIIGIVSLTDMVLKGLRPTL